MLDLPEADLSDDARDLKEAEADYYAALSARDSAQRKLHRALMRYNELRRRNAFTGNA